MRGGRPVQPALSERATRESRSTPQNAGPPSRCLACLRFGWAVAELQNAKRAKQQATRAPQVSAGGSGGVMPLMRRRNRAMPRDDAASAPGIHVKAQGLHPLITVHSFEVAHGCSAQCYPHACGARRPAGALWSVIPGWRAIGSTCKSAAAPAPLQPAAVWQRQRGEGCAAVEHARPATAAWPRVCPCSWSSPLGAHRAGQPGQDPESTLRARNRFASPCRV